MADLDMQKKIAERISKVKDEVALQAVQDEDFRAALLKDPTAALCTEYGLEPSFFSELKLRVVEEKANELVLVVPPPADDELTDEQLETVAGGAAFIKAVESVGKAIKGIAEAGKVAQKTSTGRTW
jgi:hypothetical protein